MAHAFNPRTWEAEAGRFMSSRPQGQPGLQSEFQDSQGYTEKLCLEKTKNNKQNRKKRTDIAGTGEMAQWLKITGCSSRGLGFNSQHCSKQMFCGHPKVSQYKHEIKKH